MIIIGVDFHPEFQQIASVDTESGEFAERRLQHREEAEGFYRELQGRRVAVRVGMRLRGVARKISPSAFAFVRTRCSRCIWPASSSTQYQLLRSPRSNPMVSFCCEKFLLCLVPAVLTFFIAGLLFICASSTSITWERTASRPETGLLIPSVNSSDAERLPRPRQPPEWCCKITTHAFRIPTGSQSQILEVLA